MLALAAHWPEAAMRPIRLDALSADRLRGLDEPHHSTRDVRMRTRAQMVLPAAERGLATAEVAPIARQDEETVRRWFARYLAEGVEGLSEKSEPDDLVSVALGATQVALHRQGASAVLIDIRAGAA
jgi:citrate lyase beta subunit